MASEQGPPPIPVDTEKLKQLFDVSHFDFNAVIRGAQLTLVGGMSAPRIFDLSKTA